MFKKIIMLIIKTFLWILILFGIITVLVRLSVVHSTRKSIHSLAEAPSAPAAVVFGAGLKRDGTPTLILQDRVETAVKLYQSGKVQKILMSGDNRNIEYNEPAAMRAYAISLGIPEEDIILDYAGRSTYDTCYRAKAIFKLDQAILVTQSFHLPRAVFICRAIGVDGIGVTAELKYFRKSSHLYWNIRELPATLNALLEVYILHPLPVLGDPEPIFPDKQSFD